MANKPNIRFKGFTDDWEQRKLGEMSSSFEYGLNSAATEFDGENKYIRITDIDEDSHEFNNDNLTSPETDLSNADNYKLYEGDILFARTGASVGKTYIYKVSDGLVYYAGFLIRARIKEDYNPEFVFQNTLTTDYEKFVKATSMRSGQPGINAQEYSQFEIKVPSKNEQDKIGICFRNLDHLITLHQRKCDETKKLKKFMLQKMFPKNGEKNPEIRFAGFTDDWEQRKLGEITNKGTKKNTELQYNETFTNSAEFGIISQSDFFDHSVSNPENICGYYIVENNSFVYNPRISNLAPVGPINRNKLGRIGIMSPLYTVFEVKNINVEYLEWFFKSSHWHSFMYFNGDTGARADRFSIKDTLFFEMPIPIPDIDEQAKIGEYFSTLDHLITLHQRKCDKLKLIKKFMLQNMFPKKG